MAPSDRSLLNRSLASVVDRLLEGTIVGSFSAIGPAIRSRLEHWSPPDDMTGQVVIVTGGTSGIGRATARALLELGAVVCLTSRNLERAETVAAELLADVGASRQSMETATGHDGGSAVAVGMELDTGSRESIERFAAAVVERFPSIDVLINNAGALSDRYQTDETGMELTLSTHLVGPYRLTCLLKSQLVAGARVLFMSSGGMYSEPLDVARLEMDPGDYRGTAAYARAKRAQVELAAHLGPLWAPDVIVHSVHPGWVDTPGVDNALPGFATVMGPILRQPDQGADTMVWLAAGGGADAEPGRFWHDRQTRGTAYRPGTAADPEERRRLVEWLEEQTGLPVTGD
ncbi:MAG: SDR family NAD(P)-dependent oxidoreductase [Acidimicrobiia bacterium]|nr:SDR family NAD(P)-dependent oxidoreductase [Acidimicrobiia bacterium]